MAISGLVPVCRRLDRGRVRCASADSPSGIFWRGGNRRHPALGRIHIPRACARGIQACLLYVGASRDGSDRRLCETSNEAGWSASCALRRIEPDRHGRSGYFSSKRIARGDPPIISTVSFEPPVRCFMVPALTSLTVAAPPLCVARNFPAPSQTITVSRAGRYRSPVEPDAHV